MADRYFVETPITGDRAVLTDSEAHHLAGVMRAKVGEEVIVFDGSGAEFAARIEGVNRKRIELVVTARHEIDREAPRDVTLCCVLPRGDRQRWLIEKAVELGVRRFVPLRTTRGVVVPDADVCERLRRTVIEATKQCGRNRLMEIGEASGTPPRDDLLPSGVVKWLAHPGGTKVDLQALGNVPLACLIGPEGGFTEEEAAAAQATGWQAVDLGPRILRIETAAMLLAAWSTQSGV